MTTWRHQFCRINHPGKGLGVVWAVWLKSHPPEFGYSYSLHNTRHGSPHDAGVINLHLRAPHWTLRRGTTIQGYSFWQGLQLGLPYIKDLFWPVLHLITSS